MVRQNNILLLIADDLGRMLGCYGEKNIKTPNIDHLAQQGTLFNNAFASTASCSGSRSVIYSGLHTHENGQYGLGHGKHHFMTFDQIETAPRLLKGGGYLTGIIGKVHVGPDHVYPWEFRTESPSRDVDWVALQSAEFFKVAAKGDRPFFLTVGFMDPHRDPTRGGFANGADQRPEDRVVYSPDQVQIPDFLSDIPEVRTELAEYYQAISRMDRGVGMILEALEESGFAENTLVMFVSDNGAPFLNSKTTLFDAGVRLPMIIRNPESNAGTINPNLVSFVDILPTFLDWARVAEKRPSAGDSETRVRRGRSLLPILNERDLQPHWNMVYGSHTFHEISNYYPTRFIRTERYKYHRNIAWKLDFPFSTDLYGSMSWEGMRNIHPVVIGQRPLRNYVRRPPEELYDLQEDPQEVNNLAASPTHRTLVEDLRAKMEAWQKRTRDPWLIRDGVSLLEMQPHIDAGMQMPDRFDFEWERPQSNAGVQALYE
ncbi:hypothetical protein RBB50_001200 [Rhinocladiella similis]